MVVSYIPNCWASLRRWQEALDSNCSLVTDDEFNQVDEALKNAKRQLLTLESRLAASSDRYKDTKAAEKAALQQEYDSIETTRTRLGKLRDDRISETDVYGLIRQYLPKGTDLSKHSQEELDAIALQLNMRPRKRFDFKCPIEMMGQVMQEAIAMRHDAPTSIQ